MRVNMADKIKLIIFDLDGVLVEAKNIHYDALNDALGDDYKISWNEHLSIYDGLKTNQKLEMLSEKKGLPIELHNEIWENKQKITLKKLGNLKINSYLVSLLRTDSSCSFSILTVFAPYRNPIVRY